jgi:hypothetical protein
MHAHNWATPFNEARAAAEGRRQQAICEAHGAFQEAKAEAEDRRNLDYAAARDAFDALKPFPRDPAYAETRDAFQRSKAPASLTCARKALAQAIERADLQFKADLVAAGATHKVSVGIHNPR